MKRNSIKLVSFASLILSTQFTFAGPSTLVAGGQDQSGSSGAPLLVTDTDGTGTNWSLATVTGLPATGNFISTNCGDGLCIAAGNSTLLPGAPLLALTTNPVSSWAVQSISGLPSNAIYTSADCSGTLLCTAVGTSSGSGPNIPFLIQTTNAGSAWTTPSAGLPGNGIMNSTTCSSTWAACVAVGQTSTSSTSAPIITVTTNSGLTWAAPSVPGIPTYGELVSTSCGTGNCVAVGATYKTSTITIPLLLFSTDWGNNWSVPPVTGLPGSGNFNASSCSENTGSVNNLCSAVGLNGTSNQPLVATNANARGWQVRPVTGTPTNGYFTGTSCAGTPTAGVCIAAGVDLSASIPLPLLAVSINNGTWNVVSMSGMTTAGQFYGASCTMGNSGNFVCVAAGQDFTGTRPPLLVISTDSGATWAKQTFTGIPTKGLFWSAGATPYFGIKKVLERAIHRS